MPWICTTSIGVACFREEEGVEVFLFVSWMADLIASVYTGEEMGIGLGLGLGVWVWVWFR